MTVDRAYQLLRVSPVQCLTNPLIVGSPSPSHPTVRAVFSSTAVRPSASHTMRRLRHVCELTAANVDEAHGIQRAVWEAFPPQPPACTSLGHIPAKAEGDETL